MKNRKIRKLYFFLLLLVISSCTPSKYDRDTGLKLSKPNSLTYQSFGEGDETVLLLSSIFSTKDAFLDNIALELSEKGFKVYLIHYNLEYIGGVLPSEFFSKYIKAIDEFREGLGVEKVIVAGHEISGTVAQKYTIDYSDHVSKLILISGGGYDYSFYGDIYNEKIYSRFSEQDSIFKSDLYVKFFSFEVSENELFTTIDSLKKYYLTYNKKKYFKVLNGLKNSERDIYWESFIYGGFHRNKYNFSDDLRKLKTPVLLIHGEHDYFVEKEIKELHQLLPNSKQITISNSGHFPWFENEEEFFEKLFKELI